VSIPSISIIVPTLNQAQFIEQTLASIAGQAWPRLEIIVIDGGSTDGTSQIVERYAHVVTHFISERDKGQADAINKGMRLATGDILAWLNSDDYYLPCTLPRIAGRLDPKARQLIYGNCLLAWEKSERSRIARARQPFDREVLKTCDFIYQPSAFWTRALWEAAGELDVNLSFTLDWEWWLRASALGDFIPLDECLSLYRFHGEHKTSSGSQRRTKEILALVERYATSEWATVFHAVAARLDSMAASWRRFGERGGYNLHRLRHLDLYARFGQKVDTAFWQLHV
jgi:hypothetical protein